MSFKTPLPETRNDVEWFRGLLSLSSLFFLKTLAEFGAAKDAAALAHAVALQLQEKNNPDYHVPWNWSDETTVLGTAAKSYAQALYPRVTRSAPSDRLSASDGGSLYGPQTLNSDQKAMHERAVALFKGEKKEYLDEYLQETSVTCADPQALDDIIEAGARVSSTVTTQLSSFSTFRLSTPFHALQSRNAVAFLHLIKKDDVSAEKMVQEIFAKQHSAALFIGPIAHFLTAKNTGQTGLHCLAAIEKYSGLKWSMESLDFRVRVLREYLTYSAERGVAWDEDKVMFLLGQRGQNSQPGQPKAPNETISTDNLAALPEQSSGIRFDAFDNLPMEETRLLISAALQCHCWPVVECFLKPLVNLQKQGLLPWADTQNVRGYKDELPTVKNPSTSTALGVMASFPENLNFSMSRFERTFRIVRCAGLLAGEEKKQASKNLHPAMHQLASNATGRHLEVLGFLLREGLDVDVKNSDGHQAISSLPSKELMASWEGVVLSSRANAAAQKAVASLGSLSSPATSPRKAVSPFKWFR